MSVTIPAGGNGDLNWTDNTDNWRDADATWLQERSVVRVTTTPPTVGSATGNVANVTAGRIFYDITAGKLTLSLGSSYKNILASANLNPALDSSTDVVLKVTGASYGITLKNGSNPIVLDRIDTLTVSTGGSNTAVVTTSSTGVEVDKAIRVATGTTISGTSVTSTTVTASGVVSGLTLASTATSGAPFTVASGTVVTNLNADKLDGLDAATLQNLGNATGTLDLASKTSGTLATARGGTGISTSPTVGGVAYGATTSTYGVTAAGVTGQVITSTGAAAPTWQYPDLYTCTSTTRPASPAIGQAIYETDTGNILVYYGATTGWKPPWGQPWGIVGGALLASDTPIGTSSTEILNTGSLNLRDDRNYLVAANGYLFSFGATSTMTLSPTFQFGTQTVINLPKQTQPSSYSTSWSTQFLYQPSVTDSRACRIRFTASSAGTSMFGSGNYSCSLTITDVGPSGIPPSA